MRFFPDKFQTTIKLGPIKISHPSQSPMICRFFLLDPNKKLENRH